MNKEVEDIIKKSIETLQDCERFCFITRGEDFQRESIKKLTDLKIEVSNLKDKVVNIEDEISANTLLSLECILDAIISELNMWLAFKENNPSGAWDFLINAQASARRSLQASTTISLNYEWYIEKLTLLENFLFPPQTFMSPGIVIESSRCSICNKDYGECEHLVGKAYMGKFCYRIVDKIKEMKEFSIVKEPANKHARITSFTDKGITRDIMSWKEIIDKR